jgi:hypothetical protein
MPNSLQPNPSDATAATFYQPDWNSASGTGVAVPGNRDATMNFDDIYDAQKQDALLRAGKTLPAAVVNTVTPATGPAAGGTVVTISGDNFFNATGVTFGGTAGTAFTKVNDNTVKVTTPAKAAGAYSVVVNAPGGNGTKANGFTYS